MFGESDAWLVSGPTETRMLLNEAIKDVIKNRRNRESKTYRNLAHLRTSLRSDLSCLAETAELIGLKSTNFSPPLDLGDHTIDVASKLRGLTEFRKLHAGDQLLTELAAYFHDIGKGPRQKWDKTGGHYRDDRNHPVEALPMVTRILSEEVTEIRSTRSIRLILKLVCYHDLIGDIFGKGRKPEQLSEIVSDERELDMLIALSKADILSVRAKWWDATKLYLLRKKVIAENFKLSTGGCVMLKFVSGDLFDYDASVRINTVNCVGVMGKGVALRIQATLPGHVQTLQACLQ